MNNEEWQELYTLLGKAQVQYKRRRDGARERACEMLRMSMLGSAKNAPPFTSAEELVQYLTEKANTKGATDVLVTMGSEGYGKTMWTVQVSNPVFYTQHRGDSQEVGL